MPFPRGQAIRVLDLCCGPGDVGRAIRRIYPQAQIDCIDRDPFLTSICRAANERDRIPGRLVVRDLKDDGWLDELPGNYDVVATVNAPSLVRRATRGATRQGRPRDTAGRRAIPARGAHLSRDTLRSWIRRVEGQAATALHARELGAVLVEGQRAPRL